MTDITRLLERDIVQLTATLNDWAAKFKLQPAYELSWATSAFERAAELEIDKQTLAFLVGEISPDFEGDRVEVLVKEYTRDIFQMARNISRSTSPCSNLMDECRRVAKAKLLERLK